VKTRENFRIYVQISGPNSNFRTFQDKFQNFRNFRTTPRPGFDRSRELILLQFIFNRIQEVTHYRERKCRDRLELRKNFFSSSRIVKESNLPDEDVTKSRTVTTFKRKLKLHSKFNRVGCI